MDSNSHKCIMKYVALQDPKSLPTKNYHLRSASTRIRSLATAVTDLQHTLKGVQGGDQE